MMGTEIYTGDKAEVTTLYVNVPTTTTKDGKRTAGPKVEKSC